MNNFSIPIENKESEIVMMRTIFLWEAIIDSRGNIKFIRQIFSKTDTMKHKEKEEKEVKEQKEIKQKDKILVTESEDVEF